MLREIKDKQLSVFITSLTKCQKYIQLESDKKFLCASNLNPKIRFGA